MLFQCRICDNTNDNRSYLAKEMMFGKNDYFEYVECISCGCLQIKEVPGDLTRYYPDDYYSFAPLKKNIDIFNFLEDFIRRARARYIMKGHDIVGKIIARFRPPKAIYKWLKKCGVNFNSKILDVGSGRGILVTSLFRDGFKNIFGVDPYINEDYMYGTQKIVLKKDIFSVDESFDLIMMHHSLEHMDNQQKIFRRLYDLLKPSGLVLIRVPTVSSWAWHEFGVNWGNLDAPRHLYLHSLQSLSLLAHKYGFKIKDIFFDADISGICVSRQNKRGIPLMSETSYIRNHKKCIFTERELQEAKRQTKILNNKSLGDQVAFIIQK